MEPNSSMMPNASIGPNSSTRPNSSLKKASPILSLLPKDKETPLENLVEAAARYNASEREVVTLVNAFLKDSGVNLDKNPDQVITKSKIHSVKVKRLSQLSSEKLQDTGAISFNGKKYDTLVPETYGESGHRNIVKKQNHYVVVNAEHLTFIGKVCSERWYWRKHCNRGFRAIGE
jgi:hypothetical protein